MPGESEGFCDPRSRLAREKYFCLRPRPLERWLWSKRIPASAERVFWLHWQEGMQRGDWCSEIPLSRVARECDLDVSTVTRAYQVLTRLECLRRTDQGRDPANPFQQATALTEVRVPRELLLELNRYPNRRANSNPSHRAEQGSESEALRRGRGIAACAATSTIVPSGVHLQADSDIATDRAAKRVTEPVTTERVGAREEGAGARPASVTTVLTCAKEAEQSSPADPFPGLSGRDRVRAISDLVDSLSTSERRAYQEALRMHQADMVFDADSKVPASAQIALRRLLAVMCHSHSKIEHCERSRVVHFAPAKRLRPRKLSAFELGRLSRQLQSAATVAAAPELMRQVVWSIEAGALKRFDIRHAIHIALKKIREGRWTRPNRMPPNWERALSNAPVHETCGHA